MLGDGAVSDVGGGSISASAISDLSNATIVAAQAPVSEVKEATSLEQVETTRLLVTGTQAPIGSLQVTAPSSGGGGEPMYFSAPSHPLSGDGMGMPRIPTLLITNRKSHTGFRLVPTSMTLNGVTAHILRFLSPNLIALQAYYVTVVETRANVRRILSPSSSLPLFIRALEALRNALCKCSTYLLTYFSQT